MTRIWTWSSLQEQEQGLVNWSSYSCTILLAHCVASSRTCGYDFRVCQEKKRKKNVERQPATLHVNDGGARCSDKERIVGHVLVSLGRVPVHDTHRRVLHASQPSQQFNQSINQSINRIRKCLTREWKKTEGLVYDTYTELKRQWKEQEQECSNSTDPPISPY